MINICKKTLVIGIILLFVGVFLSSAISIDTKQSLSNEESDLIEMPISIHTSNGIQRYTLELTETQHKELDSIYDKLKVGLWNSITFTEIIESQKEAIASLGEKGLLPDCFSVEEAQKLVSKNYFNPRFMRMYPSLLKCLANDNLLNFFCYINGESTFTHDGIAHEGPLLEIINYLYFGEDCGYYMNKAEGWIYTRGLIGKRYRNGSFFGRIFNYINNPFFTYCIGAVGFRGVIYEGYGKLHPSYYVGLAFWVYLG